MSDRAAGKHGVGGVLKSRPENQVDVNEETHWVQTRADRTTVKRGCKGQTGWTNGRDGASSQSSRYRQKVGPRGRPGTSGIEQEDRPENSK